jgi:hypothetical protein
VASEAVQVWPGRTEDGVWVCWSVGRHSLGDGLLNRAACLRSRREQDLMNWLGNP